MALPCLKKCVLTFVLVGILALAFPSNVMSQNFGGAPNLHCSKHGYRGTDKDYCGKGCQQRPCTTSPTPSGRRGGSVAGIETAEFFDGIKNQAQPGCAGKTFYRRDAFLNVANAFPNFGKGSAEV